MTKGYSIRKTINYVRSTNGTWIGHSVSVHNANGYTAKYPTIEAAEAVAKKLMAMFPDSDEEGYWQYARIYLGKEMIKQIDR